MNDLSDAAAAAAVLACEAARQQLEGAPHNPEGRDAPGELEKLYRWYLTQLEEASPPPPVRIEQPVSQQPISRQPGAAQVADDKPADGSAATPKAATQSAKEARRAFKRRR